MRYDEFIAENWKNYELVKQREGKDMSYREIAKPLGITAARVRERTIPKV